ncbi:MAG: patatin-like phospholipase family protein [Leptospirales bacterium]|nr:patatin-like phospholipase family protein [Leptospirales bacterium]
MVRSADQKDRRSHAQFLSAQPLFQRVAPRSQAFQRFLAALELIHIDRGDVVYRRGERSFFVYLVRHGEVHILQSGGESFGQKPVSIHGRGSLFGEVSLMTQEDHSSDAVASLDSSIYRIKGEAFLQLLAAEPSVGRAMSELLSERLHSTLVEAPGGSPARIAVLFYPDRARRGGEYVSALAETMLHQNPGPTLALCFNRDSPLANRGDDAIDYILNHWPQANMLEVLRLIDQSGVDFDTLNAASCADDLQQGDRLAEIAADLLGRLRQYYSRILIDAGDNCNSPALERFVSQCDQVVLVRSSFAAESLRWREISAFCTEAIEDFFERVLILSDEDTTQGGSRYEFNINSALYRNHLTIRSSSGAPPHLNPERNFHTGVNRAARRLSGASRALCLGGGGARAFAHIGALEVFEQADVDFDAVIGVSMGAVIAAAYAAGRDSAEIGRMVKEIIPDSTSVLDKTVPLVSFFRGRRLARTILRAFGDLRFEDLEIPFYCNAVDLDTGATVLFEQGYIATAIRASVSLPGVFPPMQLDGRALVDGGVLNNLPGNVLRSKGFHRVVGITVTPMEDRRAARTRLEDRRGGPLQKIKDYISLPPILKIISRSIAVQGIELMKLRFDDFDFILSPAVSEYDVFDFHRRDAIIEAGRRTANEHIHEIKEALLRGRG